MKLDLLPTTELQTRRNLQTGTNKILADSVSTTKILSRDILTPEISDDLKFANFDIASTKEPQSKRNPLIGSNQFHLTSNFKKVLLSLEVGKKVINI